MKSTWKFLILTIFGLFLAGAAYAGGMPDLSGVERVSPEYVKTRLDAPDVIIVDVRRVGEMIPSEKIPGARIEDWQKVGDWAGDIPRGKEIVTYCA
jgi:3-mercaptopyruvate sulfurtransferase SseA